MKPASARLRPGDVVAFLGPSLRADEARRLAPCRVLPPARAGDLLAVLPARPLAIALVDGLFDTVPSVWPREVLAALDAGVAVFGGGSMGALRAAELAAHGVVGVGRVFGWYRDGVIDDDGEVALLHGHAEDAFRPFTLPLVQVRAALEDARASGEVGPAAARAVLAAAAGIPYTARTWPAVLTRARLAPAERARLGERLPRAPDVKRADAEACLLAAAEFARARRQGAPPPPRPAAGSPPAHLRRARLARAATLLPGGAEVPSGEVLAALARRPDARRLAAVGLRRAALAALARSMGLAAGEAETAEAERAWLRRAGVRPEGRAAFLAACGLDDGAARRLCEDLALEARLLGMAERAVPDGPSWEEGLALAARLGGAWPEEAQRLVAPPTSPRRRTRRRRSP